ncbi:phosphoadenosine phosphosulfate reductase [Rhodothalassium salexigens]|uniref:phosphoadenylyl-sulfate reductase n=1 Tax=Rhodothalassium salexigens TaxID=1086 RepID=UPI0019123FDC|nr:phosphoadenylyl-sulfate reductase [Rhodothalassium salexigens]MBK5912677.1 phosphoadenosine phosphosulfate reductase [Rhodothalassium salexigens]MBK5920256.1 phosphoadenosine phosphosulfate reductase [Rhodothalassium salexigens]
MTMIDFTDYKAAKAQILSAEFEDADPRDVLRAAFKTLFVGERVALVTSFGAESAVLLHMAAQVDRTIPVVSVDTGKLFGETRRYRRKLVERLGLTNLRVVEPEPEPLAQADPKGVLWHQNADACCHVRKVVPLARALDGVDVWLSGRKRYQASSRERLPMFEAEEGRIKVNPLANWTRDDLDGYFDAHDLPRHPLEADGYLSIGCQPCTEPVAPGEDPRAGRWRGQAKTECGIHTVLYSQGGGI